MALNQQELDILNLYKEDADNNPNQPHLRYEYYQYIAAFGDQYAELAEAVPEGSTFNGRVANWFYQNQANSLYGVTNGSNVRNAVSVNLMNLDYDQRVANGGLDLTYDQIKTYHQTIFQSIETGLDCWTPLVPVEILGLSAWTTILSNGIVGSTGVYIAMSEFVADPLQHLYGSPSSDSAAYGLLIQQQVQALGWLKAVSLASWDAEIYGSSFDTADAGSSPTQQALLKLTPDGAELASEDGQVGDVFFTGGGSATAMQAVTGATVLAFADQNTLTLTGDSNQVFSFGEADLIAVSGTNNTIYGGTGASSFQISGNLNLFRGGEGESIVTLAGSDAAANIVVGGVGSVDVESTAPVTEFVGGPGSATMNLQGDFSSILLGSGDFTGNIVSNGVNIETGSGTANITVAANGGVFVTGSGQTTLSYTGGGGIFLQGDPAGYATFTVSGSGCSVYGGDVVNVSGIGMSVFARTEAFNGPNSEWGFANVLISLDAFANDPDSPAAPIIASAISAADP